VHNEARLGDNVRRWRLRRGYSQEELAQRADVHVNVVRKLEQDSAGGGRSPGVRLETLYKLARALGVQTAALWARRPVEPADRDPAQLALLPIRVALTPALPLVVRTAPGPAAEPDLAVLHGQLTDAVRFYHDDRYDAVSLLLPDLIAAARDAVGYFDDGAARTEAHRLRSGVLQLTGWFLTQVRASDLAYQAIKEAIADAATAGDQIAMAAGIIAECWLFIRQDRLLDAKRTAAAAADQMEPRMSTATAAELSAWGWLLLRAWAASVRNNQEDEATEFLRFAEAAAAAVGQQAVRFEHYWTAFGPATVAMKRVEHHAVMGDWRGALRLAEDLPAGHSRADARQRHLLDVAQAHAALGQHGDAVGILVGLRASAPGWLRHQHLGRAVTRSVLASRIRSLTADMRMLADFYDVDDI
jgi:transcriptional regulator with XRE-family HTH domain